jgi:hypothetical protein
MDSSRVASLQLRRVLCFQIASVLNRWKHFRLLNVLGVNCVRQSEVQQLNCLCVSPLPLSLSWLLKS